MVPLAGEATGSPWSSSKQCSYEHFFLVLPQFPENQITSSVSGTSCDLSSVGCMRFTEGVSLTSPVSPWKTQTQSICFMLLACEGIPRELCDHRECGFKHMLSVGSLGAEQRGPDTTQRTGFRGFNWTQVTRRSLCPQTPLNGKECPEPLVLFMGWANPVYRQPERDHTWGSGFAK